MKCKDCKDGYVTLLLTKVKCDVCDGKGFIPQHNTSCQDDNEYYPLPLPEETTQLELPWWHYINDDDTDSQCS